MKGRHDPEERNLDELTIKEIVAGYVEKLGWSVDDEITVELGGTQVSGIDVGEECNRKWQSPIGTRKYNKDCFIVIKNQSRRDLVGSLPMDREHKPQHPYTPVEPQDIVVNMEGGVGGSWEVN